MNYLAWTLSLVSIQVGAIDLVSPNMAVVPDDKPYYIQDVRNTRIIYTQDNKEYAEYTAGFESIVQPLYEKVYGYKMDTALSVGLISSYNQIANGFSTQFPTNRQVNYMGGAQNPDYFSSTSWLDTLLLHETAHNYQVNAKDNSVSKFAYKVFRNGNFYLPFFPATTPNIFESSFMLEGNAVLNESWHGRGGRLYSGRYRAMNYIQANAGNLTKERLYNQVLEFPFREGHYIFGSSYQYYLAETYGLEKTNSYFKNRSKNWYLPFTVNKPTLKTFGQYFNQTILDWTDKLKKEGKDIELAKGEVLATSKSYSDMNRQGDTILYLAAENGVRAPMLHQYDRKTSKVIKERKSLAYGRVIYKDDDYYSISGRHTSPWRITQGLFDEDAYIKEGTEGKVIQGYMSDESMVYFDVAKSFVNPQIFIDGEFYESVNSSVLVHNDNLYYFKQNDHQRTLFKNKQALYTFDGYYGIVADVDEQGAVYFIANSKLGSSLYKLDNGKITRALEGDNILAAKLAGDNKVIVEAISKDGYYYALSDLSTKKESPYVVKLMWDDQQHPLHSNLTEFDNVKRESLNDEEPYSIFNTLSYTSGNLLLIQNEQEETTYNLSAHFTDPLAYHDLYLMLQQDTYQSRIFGAGYSNNEHFLLFGFQGYYVQKNGLEAFSSIETRDYGVALDLKIPFLQKGYWYGQVDIGYFQDYTYFEKEPVVVNLSLNRYQQFGNSYFANEIFAVSVNATQDRDDVITSGQIQLSTDLPYEFYAGVKTKYSSSDTDANWFSRRGVEILDNVSFFGGDRTGFYMPSLNEDVFAKEVVFSEVNVSKVFNLSSYFFKFPLSLRREAVTLAYRQYQINAASSPRGFSDVEINQASIKVGFETTLVNNFIVRWSLEAIHNDNQELTDEDLVLFGLELGI